MTDVTTAQDNADDATPPKSPAQLLLDRFLAQSKRLTAIRCQLERVRQSIDRPKPLNEPAVAGEPAAPKSRATSFFAGMDVLAGFNEDELEKLQKALDELAALF